MGTCWHCRTEVTLSENNTKCPNCKETLYYTCWKCKVPFEVSNEKGNKIKECPVCKFFYCPSCKICGSNCKKRNWELFLIDKKLPEDIDKIIEYFGIAKVGAEEKRCPNDVGISYGKGKIKTCLLKMRGFNSKNEIDAKRFLDRLDEITNIPIGNSTTITKIRQDGTYGQEYRDVFNMGICMGLFKIERKPNPDKEKVDIQMFTRVNGEWCQYFDIKDIIYKKCSKCNKQYPLEKDYCPICIFKKGKDKGNAVKLKLCKSDKDTCQFNRNDYTQVNKKGEDDGFVEGSD